MPEDYIEAIRAGYDKGPRFVRGFSWRVTHGVFGL